MCHVFVIVRQQTAFVTPLIVVTCWCSVRAHGCVLDNWWMPKKLIWALNKLIQWIRSDEGDWTFFCGKDLSLSFVLVSLFEICLEVLIDLSLRLSVTFECRLISRSRDVALEWACNAMECCGCASCLRISAVLFALLDWFLLWLVLVPRLMRPCPQEGSCSLLALWSLKQWLQWPGGRLQPSGLVTEITCSCCHSQPSVLKKIRMRVNCLYKWRV